MGRLSFFQRASTCQLVPPFEPAICTSRLVFTALGSIMVEKKRLSPPSAPTLQPKIEELARSPTHATFPGRSILQSSRYTWVCSNGVSKEKYKPSFVGIAATPFEHNHVYRLDCKIER